MNRYSHITKCIPSKMSSFSTSRLVIRNLANKVWIFLPARRFCEPDRQIVPNKRVYCWVTLRCFVWLAACQEEAEGRVCHRWCPGFIIVTGGFCRKGTRSKNNGIQKLSTAGRNLHLGAIGRESSAIHSGNGTPRPRLPSRATAGSLAGKTVDHSNQPLRPQRHMAHRSQHGHPILPRDVLMQADWRRQIPDHLFPQRYSWQLLLYPSGATLLHSRGRIGSYFCDRGSVSSNGAKVESLCLSHTGPGSSVGSGYWRVRNTLPLSTCSVAGSSWWLAPRSHSGLFL